MTNRSHGDGTQRSVAVKSPRGWPFGPKGPFRRHVSAATSESPARVNEALQVEALWEKSRHYKSEPVPLRELSQDPVWAQLYGQATSSRDDIFVDMRITKSMLRSHMQQKKARENTDVSDEELLARLVDETPCPAPKYALPAVNADDELDGPPPDPEETVALPQPEPEKYPNVSGSGVSPHDLIAAALRAADVALRQVGEVPCEPTSAGDLPSGAAAQRLNHYGAIPFQSVGMEPSTKMSPMVSILGRSEHDPNIWDTEGARTMIYLSAALGSAPMQHREDRMRANGGYPESEQDHPQRNVRPSEGNGSGGKGHDIGGYGNGGGEDGHDDDDDDDDDDDRGKDNDAINGRGLAPAVQIPPFSGSAASDASESDDGDDRHHRSPASSPRSGPSSGARQQQPSPGSRRPAGGPISSSDEPKHTTREIFPVSPSHDGSGVDFTSPDSSPRRRPSSSPDRLRHGSFLPSGGDSPSSPRSPTDSRYPSRRHRDQGQPSVDYPHRREASPDRDHRSGDEPPPSRSRSPRSPSHGASPVRSPGRQRIGGKSGSSVPEAAAEEELQDAPADDGNKRQRPKTRGYPRRVPKDELDSPDDAAERPRRTHSPGRQGRGGDRGGQPRTEQPAGPTGPSGQDHPDSMPGSTPDHSRRRPALRDPTEPGPSSLPRLAEVAPDVVQPSSGRGGPGNGSPEGLGRQGHPRALSGSPVRTRPDGRSPSVLPRLAEVAPEVIESPTHAPHVDDSVRADTKGADTPEGRRPAGQGRPGRHFPGSMTDPDNLQGISPAAPRGSGSPTRAAPFSGMHDDSDPTHDSELRHIGQRPFDPIEEGRPGHGSVKPRSDPIRNNIPETSHRGHHPMAPQHEVGQETEFGSPEPLSGAPQRSLSDPMGSGEGPVEADVLPDIFHPSGSPGRSGGVDRGIPSAADVPSDFEQYLHDVEAMLDHMQDPNALPRAGSLTPGLHGNHPENPLASIADELVDYPFPHGSPDGHSLLEITPQFAPPGQRGLLPDDRLGGFPASQDPNFRPGYVSRPDGGPSHDESGGYPSNAPMEYGSPESPPVAYPATLDPNFRPGYVHELGGGPPHQSGGHTSSAPEGSRDEPPRARSGGYPAVEDPRYEPRRRSLPQHGSGTPHGPPYTSSGGGHQDAPGIPAGDFPGTEGGLDSRPGIGSQPAGAPPQFKSGGHQSDDGQGQRGPQPDLQAGGYPATQDPNFRPRMRQPNAEEDTAPAALSGERAAELAVPRVPGDPGILSDLEPRPSSKYKVTPYRRSGDQLPAASGLAQDPSDEPKTQLSGPDGGFVHGNPDKPEEPPGGEMEGCTASRTPGHASAPDGALPSAPGQQQHFPVSSPEPELPQKRQHDDGSTSLPTAGSAPSSRYHVTPYESSDNHPDQSSQEGTQRPSSKYKVTPYNPDLPDSNPERQESQQADSIIPGHGNQSPRHGTWENALADTRHNLGQPRFRVPISPRQSVLWNAVPDSPLSRTVLAPSTIPGDVHSPRLPVDENPLFDLNNGSTDAGSGRSLDGLGVLLLPRSVDSRGPAHPHDHAQHRAHPGPGVPEAGGMPGSSGSNGNEGEPHRKKGIPVGRVAAKMRRERKTPWQSASSNDSEDESAGNEGVLPPESLSGGRRTPAATPDDEGSPDQPHHPHMADDVASLDAWSPQQEPNRRNRGHPPALQAVEEGPEFWRDGGDEEAEGDGPRVSPRESLRQSFASQGSADEDEPWLPGQEERMENRPATRQSGSGHGGRALDGPSRHRGSPEGSAAEVGRRSAPSGTGSQHGASGERPGESSRSGSSGPVGLRLENNPLVPRRPGRGDSAASGSAPRGPWSTPDAQHPYGEEADTSPPGTSSIGPRMPAHDIPVYPDPRTGSSASTASYDSVSNTGDGDFGDPEASGGLARSRSEPARHMSPSPSEEQHGNLGIEGRSRSGQDPYAAQGPPRGNADARSGGGSPQLRSPSPSRPASPSRPVPGGIYEGHHSPPQDYQLQPPPRRGSSSPFPGHSQPEQGQSQEADDIRRQRGRDRDRRPRRHSPSAEVASDLETADEGYNSPLPGRRLQSSIGLADDRSGPEAPHGRPYSRASVSPSRSGNSSGGLDQHGRSPDSPRYPRDALLPHQLSPSGSLDAVWEQVRPRPPGIAPTQQQPPSLAGGGNQRRPGHQLSEGMQAPESMASQGRQTTPRRRSLSDSDVSEDESSNAYSLPAESWELGVRPFSSVPGRTTAPPAAEGRPMPSTRVSQPGGDEPSSSDSDYSDPLARRQISGSVSGGDSDESSAPDIPGWSEVPAGNGRLHDEELDASEAETADSISPYHVPEREDRPTSESPNANVQRQNSGNGSRAPGGGSPGGSGPRVNQSPVRPGSFLTDRGLRWSQSASPTSSSDSDMSHEDEDAAPGHSSRRVPSRQDATGPTQRSPREAVRPSRPVHDSDPSSSDDEGPANGRRPGPWNRPARSNTAAETPRYSPGQPPVPPIDRDTQVAKEAAAAASPHGRLQLVRVMRWPENEDGVGLALLKICFRAWRLLTWVKESDEDRKWATAMLSHQRLALALLYSTRVEPQPELADRLWPRRDAHRLLDSGLDKMRLVVKESKNAAGSSNPGISEEEEAPRPRVERPAPTRAQTPPENAARPARRRHPRPHHLQDDSSDASSSDEGRPVIPRHGSRPQQSTRRYSPGQPSASTDVPQRDTRRVPGATSAPSGGNREPRGTEQGGYPDTWIELLEQMRTKMALRAKRHAFNIWVGQRRISRIVDEMHHRDVVRSPEAPVAGPSHQVESQDYYRGIAMMEEHERWALQMLQRTQNSKAGRVLRRWQAFASGEAAARRWQRIADEANSQFESQSHSSPVPSVARPPPEASGSSVERPTGPPRAWDDERLRALAGIFSGMGDSDVSSLLDGLDRNERQVIEYQLNLLREQQARDTRRRPAPTASPRAATNQASAEPVSFCRRFPG